MKIFLILVILCLSVSAGSAQVYITESAHAEVSGETALTSYTGVSHALEGKVNTHTKTVEFEIPLNTIDTDNDLRNKHMNEALETQQYPKASFTGELASPFDPKKKDIQLVKVEGDFTLHGVTKPLVVNTSLRPTEDGIKFSATWPIHITDFNIERPSMMFMKVDDKHTISIRGILKSEQAF